MLALPTGGTYDDLLALDSGPRASPAPTTPPPRSAPRTAGTRRPATSRRATPASRTRTRRGRRGAGAYVFVYEDDDQSPGASGVQGGFPKTLTVPDPGYTDAGAPFTYPASLLTYTDNANTRRGRGRLQPARQPADRRHGLGRGRPRRRPLADDLRLRPATTWAATTARGPQGSAVTSPMASSQRSRRSSPRPSPPTRRWRCPWPRSSTPARASTARPRPLRFVLSCR